MTLEQCHYDDSNRTESLKRLRKLAGIERCHHVRHARFVEVGIDAVLLFDCFCAFDGQLCSKERCSDVVSLFLRCNPKEPYTQELKMILVLGSLDPQLLQFKIEKNAPPQPQIRIEKGVRPCTSRNRGFWPTALSAFAVRYAALRENHVTVALDVSIAYGEEILTKYASEMFFRIPRARECNGLEIAQGYGGANVELLQDKQHGEVNVTGPEIFVIQECVKLLIREGYDSVKKFFAHDGDEGKTQVDFETSTDKVPFIPNASTIESFVRDRLSESDRGILLALSRKYVQISKGIERRISEMPNVKPGPDKVQLIEEIDRLKMEQQATADDLNETYFGKPIGPQPKLAMDLEAASRYLIGHPVR